MVDQAVENLQLKIWNTAREEIDAQTMEMTDLQERLTAMIVNFSQVLAKQGGPTAELGLNAQQVDRATVSGDLQLDVEVREVPKNI